MSENVLVWKELRQVCVLTKHTCPPHEQVLQQVFSATQCLQNLVVVISFYHVPQVSKADHLYVYRVIVWILCR